MDTSTRRHVRIAGTVQGVGFRPYVHSLAVGLGLAGRVGNDARGVFVEVEGPPGAVATFVDRLPTEAPPLASIDSIEVTDTPPLGDTTFTIAPSPPGGERRTLVPPDAATCEDCVAEILDPQDRRFGYAFTNCTNCGPRYSIVTDVPYDRPNTTMAGFELCATCRAEYEDPADRRFHAQPTCCPACGPTLRFDRVDGQPIDGDPIATAARWLLDGRVVAVKGLGGYHLAVDATDETAAATLRARKHREDKPFAVMVADVATARQVCHLDVEVERLLIDPSRPIVLAPRRVDAAERTRPAPGPGGDPAVARAGGASAAGGGDVAVARAVAPGRDELGLLLPYTPLHHLLLQAVGGPLVMTSGNRSDEPIVHRDPEVASALGDIADAVLHHDRPIHVRVEDSVMQVVDGAPVPIRRARGAAPRPVMLPVAARRDVLAVGAELKSTVCLVRGSQAWVSPHLGDLQDLAALRAFEEATEHLARLYDVHPEVVAHDLHPRYLSTQHALDLDDVETLAVQHHHAHIASCLADNGRTDPVIGVAYDGTGYGTDGTVWGGELLVADLAGFDRVGHLATVPLPGGERAIREPWRMAASYLDAAFPDGVPPGLALVERHHDRFDEVVSVARDGRFAPATSSMGRLFDAVAALLGVRDVTTYEGHAAIELEQCARTTTETARPLAGTAELSPQEIGGVLQLPGVAVVAAVVEELTAGTPLPQIAARFHTTVVQLTAQACQHIGERTGLRTVALSGGVFQNVLLSRGLARALTERGFEVLRHRQVPPNDGGISVGQAVVAAQLDRGP